MCVCAVPECASIEIGQLGRELGRAVRTLCDMRYIDGITKKEARICGHYGGEDIFCMCEKNIKESGGALRVWIIKKTCDEV